GTSQLLIKNAGGIGGNTNIIVSSMQIDGDTNSGDLPRNMVDLTNCTNSVIEYLYIHNTPDSAIVIHESSCSNNLVQNNIIDTTSDIGIYVSVANNNLIRNNIILNTGSYGIRNVNAGAIKNSYIGNYVYNCGQTINSDGIRILNGDSCIVMGNTVIQS